MSNLIQLPDLSGTPVPAEGTGASMPLCLERHLEYARQQGLSRTSVYQRGRALIRLREQLGHDLFTATPEEMEAWRGDLVLRVCADTAAAYIWHVKSFYEWAVRIHKVRRSPAADLAYPRKGRRLPRPISDDRLFDAIAAAPERIRPMLALAGWAGLRAKEIAYLRRENVLENARPPVLLIARDATKGRNERVVPISRFVLTELIPSLPASGWVFRRADGQPGPNQPWHISHLCNDFLHDFGIPDTLHQLRHRFLTQAYAASHDLRLVQELAGHASPTTTAGYAAINNAEAAATVQALPVPRRLRSVKEITR